MEKYLLNEDLKAQQELGEDIVDDSEMHEVDGAPTQKELEFAKCFKEFIIELLDDDLAENFKNKGRFLAHYSKHCIAKDKTKKSRKSHVYYDFNDAGLYMQHEKRMLDLLELPKTVVVISLLNQKEITKAFYKLFYGDKTMVFSISCRFVSTDNEPVNIMFHSFANNYTTNYDQNTIDFMVYSRYTETLFPLDACYVETKFNTLIEKWNNLFKKPIKINR